MTAAPARPPAVRPSRTPRTRRALAGAVQLVVLACAVAGTAAFVSRDHRVTISVDGSSRTVRTFSSTVHGVLGSAGLAVGPHDVVTPALDAHLGAGDTVVLRRGRPLQITVDGRAETVWTTATSVADALGELGLDRTGEYVSASRSRPIGLGGAAFDVRLPQRVVVVHDGRAQAVTTAEPTVAAMLADAHVQLRGADVLSVPARTYPLQGMVVRVTRIAGGRVVDDEVIPQTTTHVADPTAYVGDETVVDEGSPGVVRYTYALLYHDGKLASKTLLSKVQTAAMRPRVVHDGTRPRPVAAPVASSGGLDWGALADCESGGDPTLVSGNGEYYGLYQFSLSTWQGVGGSGRPSDASSAEQTRRAEILYGRVGRSAWPTCGQYL